MTPKQTLKALEERKGNLVIPENNEKFQQTIEPLEDYADKTFENPAIQTTILKTHDFDYWARKAYNLAYILTNHLPDNSGEQIRNRVDRKRTKLRKYI